MSGAAAPPDQPHPFQSLKGFQRFCSSKLRKTATKNRWLFQSLKGFQRFCSMEALLSQLVGKLVSIPKRVSEVL